MEMIHISFTANEFRMETIRMAKVWDHEKKAVD